MKFSFCTIAYRHREMNLHDLIFILAELGYDGVEIWGEHIEGRETSVEEYKKLIDWKGIEVSMISPYFDLTTSFKRWRTSITKAREFIKVAHTLDCSYIRVFTGNVPSDLVQDEQWEQCVDGLQIMADDAAEYDVTLCVENHANTLADTPESTEKLLTEVGRDNVGLILDFTNFWEVEETPPLALIDRFYPWIKHIHAKNAEMFDSDISPYRYVMEEGHDLVQEDAGIRTLADGELDYVEILEDLDRRDFDKFFSIECFETRRSPLRVAKDELEYCQNVINSREQTSRREETVEPSRRSANEPADERAFEL